MKITLGKIVLRGILYIVLMNIFMFILCTIFQSDYDPTLIGSVVVPVSCAYASLWAEKKKFDKWKRSE